MKHNMNLWLFAFFTVFVLGATTGISYAQTQCASCVQIPRDEIKLYTELFPLTIWTDSQKYNHNSTVNLDGHLRPENTIHPVTLTVTNPIGNVVAAEQTTPDLDGAFHVEFQTSSTLWMQDGPYIIKAQSGGESRFFKTQVELVSHGVGAVMTCTDSEIIVEDNDNGKLYCIPYSTLGKISNVDGSLSVDSKTLSLDIISNDFGSITLSIPRYLIDAHTLDGDDTNFGVFWNDKATTFVELQSNDTSRIITISHPPNQHGKIDIVGTTVIPEFGSASAVTMLLVMVIGITATLFFSMKRFGMIRPMI